MLLAIDVGNTSTEFGIFNKEKLIATLRLGTKKEITSDEIWLYLSQFFNHHHIPRDYIDNVAISSVVPQTNHSLVNAIRKYYKIEPYVIGENLPCYMTTKYEKESALGTDRLVDAYAAYHKFKSAVIVVDFGTATTVDAVSSDGEFLGGMIFPGVKTSTDALFEKAAKLTKVEIIKPEFNLGTSSSKSLQLGFYYGYIGAVERMVYKAKQTVGNDAKVIATGGFSKLFSKENIFDYTVPFLQLEGIRLILDDYIMNNTKHDIASKMFAKW